jgi:hypothetical protein
MTVKLHKLLMGDGFKIAAFEVFESLVKFFEVSEEPKLVQVC